MVHVHHFLQDENLLITIFDQIDTARMIVVNELVAVFDEQSDIGDHLGGADDIFQHKMQSQGHIMFAVVVGLLCNEAHQCGCFVVLQDWFESLGFGSVVMWLDLFWTYKGTKLELHIQ